VLSVSQRCSAYYDFVGRSWEIETISRLVVPSVYSISNQLADVKWHVRRNASRRTAGTYSTRSVLPRDSFDVAGSDQVFQELVSGRLAAASICPDNKLTTSHWPRLGLACHVTTSSLQFCSRSSRRNTGGSWPTTQYSRRHNHLSPSAASDHCVFRRSECVQIQNRWSHLSCFGWMISITPLDGFLSHSAMLKAACQSVCPSHAGNE